MKLIYLLITLGITVSLMLATTLFLDLPWIQRHWIRMGIIHLVILFEMGVGMAVFREILRMEK